MAFTDPQEAMWHVSNTKQSSGLLRDYNLLGNIRQESWNTREHYQQSLQCVQVNVKKPTMLTHISKGEKSFKSEYFIFWQNLKKIRIESFWSIIRAGESWSSEPLHPRANKIKKRILCDISGPWWLSYCKSPLFPALSTPLTLHKISPRIWVLISSHINWPINQAQP